ncbi:hypothetical protein TREES_T100008773 [Tupaia chinensis]|uniref:Uncharacterized protein n=1 Tax=Tupaia chinensis TaxID=246437 RepID=L9L588_TUPCH|nr:hypothetical protein TREES_T100008773 [Tupaia chinensis]
MLQSGMSRARRRMEPGQQERVSRLRSLAGVPLRQTGDSVTRPFGDFGRCTDVLVWAEGRIGSTGEVVQGTGDCGAGTCNPSLSHQGVLVGAPGKPAPAAGCLPGPWERRRSELRESVELSSARSSSPACLDATPCSGRYLHSRQMPGIVGGGQPLPQGEDKVTVRCGAIGRRTVTPAVLPGTSSPVTLTPTSACLILSDSHWLFGSQPRKPRLPQISSSQGSVTAPPQHADSSYPLVAGADTRQTCLVHPGAPLPGTEQASDTCRQEGSEQLSVRGPSWARAHREPGDPTATATLPKLEQTPVKPSDLASGL